MKSLSLPFTLLCALLTGCSTEVAGPADPDGGSNPPTTTRERLATPTELVLSTESHVELHATMTWPEVREADVDLEVAGSFSTQALPDGSLALDALTVDIGDVVISPETLPPNGLHLTDVRLVLEAATSGEGAWTFDDNRGVAELAIDLTLEWSIVTSDGEAHPLAPQHLADLPAMLVLESDAEGELVGRLEAEREGIFFEWSGLIELSDLQVSLRAGAEPQPDDSL